MVLKQKESVEDLIDFKKRVSGDISRLRSEVRELGKTKELGIPLKSLTPTVDKSINSYTGIVSGNFWTQNGMPWVSNETRKAVITEYYWQPIRGQPRRVDFIELRQFSQTFWIHVCVKTIIDEICALDWDIKAKEGYNHDKLKNKIEEVKNFLMHPNKNRETFSHVFIRQHLKDILELDSGVLVKVFSFDSYDFDKLEPKSGAPLLKPLGQRELKEIYCRDGASFLIEGDKFGYNRGYWQYSYQIPAHPMWFNKDEICYTSETPRSTSFYGYARTQAILDIIKSLHYSTIYNKKYFEETGMPDGVLALLDTNEDEMKSMADMWIREFKAQPHKFAVVNKDVKWENLSIPNTELQFLETQKQYFQFIIAMFGLTPSELGLTEDVNRATSQTQAELTKRKGIRPWLRLLENTINKEIIPEFGEEGIEFTFIYDDPQEMKSRLENWKIQLEMGIITPNEIRQELGLAPIQGGDYAGTQVVTENPENVNGNKNSNENVNGGQDKDSDIDPKSRPQGQNKRIKDEQEERDKQVQDPYSMANRPVGSFKGISKSLSSEDLRNLYEKFGEDIYKILISMGVSPNKAAEISQRIKVRGRNKSANNFELVNNDTDREMLRSSIVSELAAISLYEDMAEKTKDENLRRVLLDIAQEEKVHVGEFLLMLESSDKNQESAIEEGKSEAKDLLKKNVGQYYNEPDEVIQEDRGFISQPQNDPDLVAPQLGSDYRNGQTYVSNNQNESLEINCPNCGRSTLKQDNNADDIGQEKILRCLNCCATFREDELLTENFSELEILNSQGNPYDQAIEIPKWSPKSSKDYKVKEWCGFDFTKFIQEIDNYVLSEEYKKLLEGYLTDMSKTQIMEIIEILNSGIRNNLTITQIANRIKDIVGDLDRARLISRTETIRITNEANRLNYKKKDVKKVEWVSAGEDGRLCKECKKMNGKIIPIDKIKNMIPVHTNCRCSFVPYNPW